MSMVIDEQTIGLWFQPYMHDDQEGDWLASARKTEKDGKDVWELTYRFRYYLDAYAHDSKDTKSWYHGFIDMNDTPADKLIEQIRTVCTEIGKTDQMHRSFSEILMDENGVDSFLERLKKADFAHCKEETLQ